jgi:pilus assembly protein FimV
VGLDFDLDLGAPEPAQSLEATPQAEASSDVISLDIDFDMPAKESPAPALDFPLAAEKPSAEIETPVIAPVVAPEDSGGIDFDFDLGTPASGAPAPLPEMSIETPAASAPAAIALDLGEISLELDTPEVSASAAPEPVVAEMPDNPEVATKIELALAYEEMGDRDGARELFQEALAEGSPAQQKVARAKLDSFG